jgi:hypothetical protein
MRINRDGLFQLDVDDDIWQDIGLDDDEWEMTLSRGAPLWLTNTGVREGIKVLLDLDRCLEEESRLQVERCNMQEWLKEDWECVQAQLSSCSM